MAMTTEMTPWPEQEMAPYHWLDELLQQQPATERQFQAAWQAYKYLLRGKMYAYIGSHEPDGRPIITLKLEPALSDALRQEHADIIPGYYMNKQHWSTIYLDGAVPQQLLRELVIASHQALLATLSKKAQQEILAAER